MDRNDLIRLSVVFLGLSLIVCAPPERVTFTRLKKWLTLELSKQYVYKEGFTQKPRTPIKVAKQTCEPAQHPSNSTSQEFKFRLEFSSDQNLDLDEIGSEVLCHFRYAGFNWPDLKKLPTSVDPITCSAGLIYQDPNFLVFWVEIVYTVSSVNISYLPDVQTQQAPVSQHPSEVFSDDPEMATLFQNNLNNSKSGLKRTHFPNETLLKGTKINVTGHSCVLTVFPNTSDNFNAHGFFGKVRYSLTLDVSKKVYADKEHPVDLPYDQLWPVFVWCFQNQGLAAADWVIDPLDAGRFRVEAESSDFSRKIIVVYPVKMVSYNPLGTFNSNGKRIGESPYGMPQKPLELDTNEIFTQLTEDFSDIQTFERTRKTNGQLAAETGLNVTEQSCNVFFEGVHIWVRFSVFVDKYSAASKKNLSLGFLAYFLNGAFKTDDLTFPQSGSLSFVQRIKFSVKSLDSQYTLEAFYKPVWQ